jgi:hypothetical protein
MEELNRRAAYARLTRGLSNSVGRSFQQVPLSTDSLVIPPRTHGNRRKPSPETTTDEGSSEDESDATESTSVSAESRPDVEHPMSTSGTPWRHREQRICPLNTATGKEARGLRRRFLNLNPSSCDQPTSAI